MNVGVNTQHLLTIIRLTITNKTHFSLFGTRVLTLLASLVFVFLYNKKRKRMVKPLRKRGARTKSDGSVTTRHGATFPMAFHKSEPHQTFAHTLYADASQGNKDALLSSLDAGTAVDEMDGSGTTPLMHAVTWIAYGC